MASENENGDLTVSTYWGQLRAWGLSNPQRVTERTYTMLTRDRDVVNVRCPERLTPLQRQAALDLIKATHIGQDH